jgi:hypothetical protein
VLQPLESVVSYPHQGASNNALSVDSLAQTHTRLSVKFNSPQPNHLAPTIFKNLLKIFNFLISSFELLSAESPRVTTNAALYTKNVTNGGRKLKSIDSAPSVKGSIVLITVERTAARDSSATYLQLSVIPAIRGTLVPFSKAKRRELVQCQHQRSHTQTPIRQEMATHVLQRVNPPE